MLLDNNTEKVMNLAYMVDDLKEIDKVRLAIYLLENLGFNTDYDITNFIKILKDVLEMLDLDSKNVITNFSKYKNLLLITSKYMELSLKEKKNFSVELLFNIYQFDFKNEEINILINQYLNVYEYCYSFN